MLPTRSQFYQVTTDFIAFVDDNSANQLGEKRHGVEIDKDSQRYSERGRVNKYWSTGKIFHYQLTSESENG